jgi:hypothetical protein
MRASDEIVADLIQSGKSVAPYLGWLPKTPQGDMISIVASEFSRAYTVSEYVKKLSRLDGYTELDNDESLRSLLMTALNLTEAELDALLKSDLDNFASMWAYTRKPAMPASGAVILSFSIDSSPITITKGSRFQNVTTLKYYTLRDSVTGVTPVMAAGETDYKIYVMLESEDDGTAGNVIAGSTFRSVSSIINFITSTNPLAFDNGIDEETNTEFVTRIKLSRVSKGVGSKSYITALMLSDARVFSVWLNAKGEQWFERPWGIDIWVQAAQTATVSTAVAGNECVLVNAPLISASIPVTLDNGWYSHSTFELNKATSSVVTYYYDQTVRDLQGMLEDADNWLLGGQSLCLVKMAYRVPIDIAVKIFYIYSTDPTFKDTVDANIAANLLLFFTGGRSSYGKKFSRKLLGVDVDKSDILNVILSTDGVDRVELTGSNAFTTQRHDGLYPTADPITILPYEYSSLGAVTLARG